MRNILLLFVFSFFVLLGLNSYGQTTVDYYFDSRNSPNNQWDTGEDNLVDGVLTTSANDNNNGHYIHMNSNTCPGTNLGTITKVEIRAYFENNYDVNATRTIAPRLIPYFNGSSVGSNYDYPNGNYDGSAGYPNWGSYFDITNDANAPATWSWSDIQNLECRLVSNRPSGGQHKVYKVEIQVTYTPDPPDCTWQLCLGDSYGDGWNGGSIEVFVAGSSIGAWTLSDGTGPGCIDIPIHLGDEIILDYTAGSWSSENAYYLTDSYGSLVYSSGDDGSTPVDYTLPNANCSQHSTPNEQDCLGAISICGDTYSTTNSYEGTGNVPFEINGSNSCLYTGELNDVWYTFTVQQDGDLMFTITPNTATDDYDWAVFDLTNSNCSDIATDPTIEVSCNYSGTSGDTGPDGSTALSSQGGGGTPFNDGIPVVTGEVYAINVSNYSSTQDGYTIDFSMSSGVIVDVTPPELQSIVSAPTCGQDQITAWFTELVDTLSVDASDFTVTGPGGPYSITYVTGTSGVDQDREYELTLSSQLIAGGTYTLVFSGQIDDACGNQVTGNSLDFTVAGVSGSTVVNDGTVLCYDDAVGTATASASGGSGTYSYLWSTGATTASINSLVAGTYTVTVSDDVGVCYDVVNAVVNASNSTIATGTWAGTSNTDWNDCENWGGGRIPLSSTDVTIPTACSNYPIIPTNVIIDGATGLCNSIRIESGSTFTVNGNITLQNGGSILQSGGDLFVGGDFTNNSTFTSTSGETSFNGSSIQLISGSQSTTFYDLKIDNSSDVVLSVDISIKNNLTMNAGDLNISDKIVDFGNTGTLVNETASSRVKSVDGGGIPMVGGYLIANRVNPSGNIAGLGLIVTPSSPLGNTTIKRGHEELQGTGSYTSNSSILRYYDLTTDIAKGVITNDLVFNYFDSELNGHADGTLIMYQEIALYGGAAYWSPLSTVNSAVANTATSTSINNDLTTTKLTLGSDAMPLPINLIEFNATCNTDNVELTWKTESEINNDYFTILKSINGINFNDIGIIEGSGNSNLINNYSFIDYDLSNETTYYKLRQTDYDNTSTEYDIISLNCFNSIYRDANFNLYPNPAKSSSNVYLEISGYEKDASVLVVINDILGNQLYSKVIITDFDGDTIFAIDDLNRLKPGTYIIVASSKNELYKKKLIIN